MNGVSGTVTPGQRALRLNVITVHKGKHQPTGWPSSQRRTSFPVRASLPCVTRHPLKKLPLLLSGENRKQHFKALVRKQRRVRKRSRWRIYMDKDTRIL
jgi:hypothetical protein